MASDVGLRSGEGLAQSLADCEAYWSAQGTLTAAQQRRREFERELRVNCAAQGCGVPAANDPTIAEIRSGQWEKRQRQNMQNLLRDRARLAHWKREGYSFDAEHRLVAPVRVENAPRRVATTSRARPRGRTARTAVPRGSPDDDDPEPGRAGLQRLRVIEPARFRRDVDAWLGAVWVDLSEELVEHVERRAKIEDAAGGGPFASGGAS